MKQPRFLAQVAGLFFMCLATSPALAQEHARVSVEQFYKGRTISLLVASSAGGRYDTNARHIARHLGRFIPGQPTVIVQNAPAGGGLVLANRLYNTAERDGSVIAVVQPGTPQVAIQGNPNAKFDPLAFTWIGSLSSFADDADLLVLTLDHSAKSASDLKKPDVSATLGSGTPGSTNLTFALIARDILGLNLRIVRGYRGSPALFLGMQNGEVDGHVVLMSSIKTTQRHLWDAKQFRPVVQFGRITRHPELPDVPTARELINSPDGLAMLDFAELAFFMSLPVVAPPGLPPERAAALQSAFMAMVQDETFRNEAIKAQIDLSPIDGEAVLALIRKAATTPKEVIEQYNQIVPAGG